MTPAVITCLPYISRKCADWIHLFFVTTRKI